MRITFFFIAILFLEFFVKLFRVYIRFLEHFPQTILDAALFYLLEKDLGEKAT